MSIVACHQVQATMYRPQPLLIEALIEETHGQEQVRWCFELRPSRPHAVDVGTMETMLTLRYSLRTFPGSSRYRTDTVLQQLSVFHVRLSLVLPHSGPQWRSMS
jgi:hypothetical protein